jgi:TolB protein
MQKMFQSTKINNGLDADAAKIKYTIGFNYLKFKSSSLIFFYLFIFIVAMFCGILFKPHNASAKVYINIYQASIKKIRIAVPDFKNLTKYKQHSSLASKLAHVVRHDLSVIGYFHIVNPLSYLENPQDAHLIASKIKYSDWTVLNTEYLINGSYKVKGGHITLKANLISIYSQKLLFSEVLEGSLSKDRYLANKFADAVLKFLTGKKGPFTTKVFFVGEKNNVKNIFEMDFGGHRVKRITDNNSINIFPYPSPDGKKIAYISFKDGDPAVFIKNLITGRTTKLDLPGPADFVSWSPNGKKLALALTPGHYNTQIYTINADGKGLKRLTDTFGINTSPSFSPNGNRIVFVSNRGGGPQIYVMNSNGSDVHMISFNGSYYNTSPAWSPNGKKIVFTSFINGALQVCIINPDGSNERQLTDTPYGCHHPSWTRDSRIISFDTEFGGREEIYLMDTTASGIMLLMPHIFPEMQNYYNPAWTLKSTY